jgi:hypothetical protein
MSLDAVFVQKGELVQKYCSGIGKADAISAWYNFLCRFSYYTWQRSNNC